MPGLNICPHNPGLRQSLLMATAIAIVCCVCFPAAAADFPDGFQNARWGMTSDAVRSAADITAWQPVNADATGFPKDLNITVFTATMPIAGYPATVKYYFIENYFFQATVAFNFSDLKSFDFNYNVFISVDRYYRAIHDKTLLFVRDIFDLLTKKYGKREPVFKGLDPRNIFVQTDACLRQEQWNLRYHPYEFYKRIVCAAYARWDFPKTRAIFSINISAADNRFDYLLSLTSIDLEGQINQKKDLLRSQGL
jgi:hypothetical protein